MHCSVLTFGRIEMSLFPRIRIISAFIAFSSQHPVGTWRVVVPPSTLHLNELLSLSGIFANE